MNSEPRTIEQIEIHLKYEGPDVENGTMDLQDVIPVLQGFSGAFSRLSGSRKRKVPYRIELSGIRNGSADIVLEIRQWLIDSSDTIVPLAGLTTIGMYVAFPIVKRIIEVIRIKAHVGTDEPNVKILAEKSIVVSDSTNVNISVSPEAYDVYKNGTIDEDLEQITRPLQEGRIDSAEFEVQGENQESFRQRITSDDRPHFEIREVKTTTEETELVATLNSLTKSTNNGFLYLHGEKGKKRVTYHYKGDDHSKLYSIFGIHSGCVKIRCKAKLDEHLNVLSVDIYDIERLQMDMFDET